MKRFLVLAAICLFFSTTPPRGVAQTPASAMDAYEHVQQLRDEATNLWRKAGARREQIEQGIEVLEKQVLPYLNDPLVEELARGNLYLKARRYNVFMDLAKANAILGRDSEAIQYLRKTFAESNSGWTAREMREQQVFDALRQNREFKELLDKIDAKYIRALRRSD